MKLIISDSWRVLEEQLGLDKSEWKFKPWGAALAGMRFDVILVFKPTDWRANIDVNTDYIALLKLKVNDQKNIYYL